MQYDTKYLLKLLPFYNSFIHYNPKKRNIKKLSNLKLLQELSLYDELSIGKNSNAFIAYARSYKVKYMNKKDPLVQLEASKLSIKNFFKGLLIETRNKVLLDPRQ